MRVTETAANDYAPGAHRGEYEGFGVRQYAGVLLSVSMILIGYLGLTGTVTAGSVLFAGIFVAVAVLSFSLGQHAQCKTR